jgi:hypothetical protein
MEFNSGFKGLKCLIEVWERNESKSGPTLCPPPDDDDNDDAAADDDDGDDHDNDDDDDDDDDMTMVIIKSHTKPLWILFRMTLVLISAGTQHLRNFNQFFQVNVKYFLP